MQKLEFDWEMNIPIYQYRGWDKSPSLDIFFGIVEQDAVVEWALLS